MKNLKKVLALVLALATVMGLGITASAKEYTDAKNIAYTEAVDVMSAIGVLSGNPDGSFAPTKNLTRVQAAKMVSYLLNGGKDVNDLYAGANTFTDCYSNWGKGYIAYVNQMGIVSGVGNGKFNPNGTLTGVALAKMMLTSLGYDANIEGYQNNNNWMVNIINDAQTAGLLKGMDTVNLYNAITREQASQMMFNALKATMVSYSSKGTEITLPGVGTIITGASDPAAVAQGAYANNMRENVGDTSKQTLQLAEKYFGGTKGLINWTSTTDDDFGRPAHEWKYDAKTVGTYANEADLTYTVQVKAEDIYKDLGKVGQNGVTVYTDGKSAANTDRTKNISATSTDKFGGQGAKTEVFVDNTGNTPNITVVVTNTYSGKINKFTKATDTADAYITITKESGDAALTAGGKFETNVFTKDDEGTRVLYTKADGAVKSVVKAESVDGAVTKFATNSSGVATSVTIDGTTYKAANKATALPSTGFNSFEDTYTFYLDTYGNVIYSELKQAGASKDYAYVVKVEESNSLSSGTGVKAQIVLADGTKTIVDIDTYTKSGNTCYKLPAPAGNITTDEIVNGTVTGTVNGAVGNWFAYTVNSDKEYTFSAINATYAKVESGLTLTKDKAYTVVGVGSGTTYNAYTTANTVVTVVDTNDKVSTATGLIGATLTGKVLVTYGKDSKTIDAIYAVNQTTGLSTADVTYAYALKADGTTKDGVEWKFAIDGKTVTYVVDSAAQPTAGGIYNLVLSDNKITSGSTAEVANTKTGTVDYADANTVVITGAGAGTYTTGEKFAVYNVDSDLDSSNVGMTDTLEKGDVVKFVTNGTSNGTILVAFIIAEAE